MNQRRRFKIIIYIFLLLSAILAYAWWLNYNWTKENDYKRISDMRVLQGELLFYYSKFNTFVVPNCDNSIAVNFCHGKNEQIIRTESLIDPMNQGDYRYIVDQLSSDNFRISFVTQSSLPGMPAGRYFLTKDSVVR